MGAPSFDATCELTENANPHEAREAYERYLVQDGNEGELKGLHRYPKA